MNDRFKFRVFGLCCNSKLEKNWVNITEVGKFFIDKDGKLIDESAYFDPMNHPEHFIIEQCTGLSDKNGKLIYEGDIVSNGYKTGVVKYGEFNCSCCDGVYGWYFDDADIRDVEFYEIIGNIHEQKEQQ